MTTTEPQEDTQIERVVRKIGLGEILALTEVLEALHPAEAEGKADAKAPAPAKLPTEAVKAAALLPKVFGKVCPEAVRELTPEEIGALYSERMVLDVLKKTISSRTEAIRASIFNHLDERYREEVGDAEFTQAERDKDGHLLVKQEAPIPDTDKIFRREPRTAAATLDGEELKMLAEDPAVDYITHDDYLAMTTQTRVIDEAKVMIHLRSNPQVLKAIGLATRPGKKSASLNIRSR